MCAILIILKYKNSTVFTFQAANSGALLFWQFVPIILAVAPGLVWEVIYIEVCRLQPYRDLASPQGSTLRNSLSQTYLTSFSWFVPYHALNYPNKHTGVASISIAYLLSCGVLPTLTGAMIKLHWDKDVIEGNAQPLIYLIFLGLLVSLSIVAFAVAAFISLRKQKSGLYTNPTSLAGLGTMISESNLLPKFQSLRSFETQEGIDKALGDLQLRLEYVGGSYQITLLDPNQNVLKVPEQKWLRDSVEAHPWWLRGWTYIGLNILTLVPSIALYATTYQQAYNAVVDQDPLEINGSAFAVKICTTIITLINAALYANWHLYVAILQPFHKLAECFHKKVKGSSIALRMDFTGSAIFNLLRPQQYFEVWLMAVCALLTELAIIIQPAVYQNLAFIAVLSLKGTGIPALRIFDEMNVPAGVRPLRIIFYVFAGIYGIFALFGLVLVLSKKRKPFLPRKPYTLSSQILYLCHGTEFLSDLKGMQSWSKKARDARLKQNGHKYGLGWIEDESKCSSYLGIDRVENISQRFRYPKADPAEGTREHLTQGMFERLHPNYDEYKTRRDAGWPENAQ